MSDAALLQLVAYGNQNQAMNLTSVAYDYLTHPIYSNGVLITRNSDIITPEYLELTFTNPDSNNLDYVKKLILKMTIGGATIQQFPLSLLINLNEPIICDGKMYINLCFDMLFGELKMVGLMYHDIYFQLDNTTLLTTYGITTKLTYLDTTERRNIAQNSFEELIQQITFIDIKADINDENQTSNIYELRNLPFENISKGFFIECNDVDNLNNINLKFNGRERFNFNRFLIRTKCKKIKQNLLYFPFNYAKEYTEKTIVSYEGGANLSRMDSVQMTLNFDTAINNVKIYNLSSNLYRQMSGMGGIAYSISFWNGTYDIRNNQLTRPEPVIPTTGVTMPMARPPTVRPSTVGTTIVYTGPTNKPITDASSCPISCEPIVIGEKYMSCHQCNNNFSEVAFKQWLESRRPNQRTCPLCRVQWSNCEVYINGDIETNVPLA